MLITSCLGKSHFLHASRSFINKDMLSVPYLGIKHLCLNIVQVFISIGYFFIGITAGKHVFTQSFLQRFQSLLKTSILQSAEQYPPKLVAICRTFINASKSTDLKNSYKQFTQILRDELQKNKTSAILQNFCYALYTQDLSQSYDELIIQELKVKDMWDNLHNTHLITTLKKISLKMSSFWKFIGYPYEFLYDPRMEGNLPSKLYDMQFSDHTVEVIRTPNVTKDTPQGSEIVPEFEGFLAKGHQHLYINLMQSSLTPNNEKRRTDCIHTLEKSYPNLTVISLDKDSCFYKQTESFSKMNDFNCFKNAFIDRLVKQINFRFPENFDIKSFITPIVEQIHQQYFNDQPSLLRHQRRAFIELTYTVMIKKLCENLKPKILNVSCKSTVDRGSAQLAMLHAYCHQKKQTLDKALILRLAFGPAIAYKNRAMLSDRFKMLIQTLEYLL